MRLLQLSIQADGYTQPIVGWKTEDGEIETVDGFHRGRCGKEVGAIRKRVMGRLPVAVINAERTAKEDRVAATIRHNRARGRHAVDAMSDIVVDLKRRNWSDAKIAKELGMEPDEVLKLAQISGLAEMFANQEFSQAWEPSGKDEDS
jgi:ParB-like chromosome segregation protein Spo0J